MLKNTLHRTFASILGASIILWASTAQPFSKPGLHQAVARARHLSERSLLKRPSTRRAPRTYDVLHYLIRTSFDVPRKTVAGEVVVTLKPLAPGFRSLELDAADMKIEGVSLGAGNALRSLQQDEKLLITLDRAYDSSSTIVLSIRYRAKPRRGLYFVSPSRESGFQRPSQIWTQGEPEDNHHWFPCYDFPDDKATSEQYITTRGGELAIANGTLVETASNPDGTLTYHWQMDQPHSSYLISLIVGDYVKLSDSYKDIPIEYYTYRGTVIGAQRAFGKTPLMMRWFSNMLKYEYPYKRYAQTVVGNFIFGGMENITATTYADSEILDIDDKQKAVAENLVSHELAHSWFGNLVTCKDWSHLWLNEGLATFMEAAFLEQSYGRTAYLSEMDNNMTAYFQEDPGQKRHPLVNPRYSLSMELFDETTYKKGAYVIHMLRETVGEDTFWKALNAYLNEFKYNNVESSDLQRVFERVSGQQLGWFFDQWVYKAGYPELRVRSQYSPDLRQLTLTVAQRQKEDAATPGIFRLPLEIQILTPTGWRSEHIEINKREQAFVFQLDSRPRAIMIDPGSKILKKIDFPKSQATAELIMDGTHRRARNMSLLSVYESSGTFALAAVQNPDNFHSWPAFPVIFKRLTRFE